MYKQKRRIPFGLKLLILRANLILASPLILGIIAVYLFLSAAITELNINETLRNPPPSLAGLPTEVLEFYAFKQANQYIAREDYGPALAVTEGSVILFGFEEERSTFDYEGTAASLYFENGELIDVEYKTFNPQRTPILVHDPPMMKVTFKGIPEDLLHTQIRVLMTRETKGVIDVRKRIEHIRWTKNQNRSAIIYPVTAEEMAALQEHFPKSFRRLESMRYWARCTLVPAGILFLMVLIAVIQHRREINRKRKQRSRLVF